MNILDFKSKWSGATLTERSAAHQHFLDLCEVLGVPKPAELDPRGDYYTFEKGVSKLGGGRGFADVWYRDHFAWEYKGLHANLAAAYAQLKLYAEDLENPPLLVVCDLDRFEIHTQFNNMANESYAFGLAAIGQPAHLACSGRSGSTRNPFARAAPLPRSPKRPPTARQAVRRCRPGSRSWRARTSRLQRRMSSSRLRIPAAHRSWLELLQPAVSPSSFDDTATAEHRTHRRR